MTTIALGQMRCDVGDIYGNALRIQALAEQARQELGADLIVFPELALTGYPPEDLLLRPSFVSAARDALLQLAASVRGVDLLVGLPWADGASLYNAAAWVRDCEIIGVYYKQLLPNYGVFDERRYFVPGSRPLVCMLRGIAVGVTICEDLWEPGPSEAAKKGGAQIIVNINASPYQREKPLLRSQVAKGRVSETGLPLVYVNMVGGQDELVFDGASFVLDEDGESQIQAPAFAEDLVAVHLDAVGRPEKGLLHAWPQGIAALYEALLLGLRDYVNKNGFTQVFLGLSGGIDSALALALCCDALPEGSVHAVMMPSRYTDVIGIEDAQCQAAALKVPLSIVSIEEIYESFAQSLCGHWEGLGEALAAENLQARIRGSLLMSMANAKRALVIVTSNKSEIAVGYTTLYGDMAGGYAPLKDVFKTGVYALARYRNAIAPVIPERVLVRPPTAELRFDQKDTDSLPPYSVLDDMLVRFVEQDCGPEDLVAEGFDPELVERVLSLVRLSEHKRKQAPLGTRVSPRAFGRDWRYPVTARYRVGKM